MRGYSEEVHTSKCRQDCHSSRLRLLDDREVTFGFPLSIFLCFSGYGIEDILFLLPKKITSVLFHFEKVKGNIATTDNLGFYEQN